MSNSTIDAGDHHPLTSPVKRLSYFTICAQNYLAFAIVLGRSIAQTTPAAKLTVFVLDGIPDDTSGMEHLDLKPAESVFAPEDWRHLRAYYNILEFSTSIKPACFLRMIEDGHEFVVYLDPDIKLFKPLTEISSAFDGDFEVVITPHILEPFPQDGCRPNDLDILNAGIYNLGFAAFRNSPACIESLRWWDRKLRTLCFSDIREGVFTDQKWINFLPGFDLNVFVLKHPGYNAAYWNLHERSVIRQDGEWFALQSSGNLEPLVFFHFSGFDPNRQDLSKHQDRYKGKMPGDLKVLLAGYAEELKSSGFDELMLRKFPELKFNTGETWDPVCRIIYQDAIKKSVNFANPLNSDEFFPWMASPEPGDHLSRYLRAFLKLRPDLALVYDDGKRIQGFLNWIRTYGKTNAGINEAIFSKLEGLQFDRSVNGINYVGYFRSHMGVAQAARGYLDGIIKAGILVNAIDVSDSAVTSETSIYPHGTYKVFQDLSQNNDVSYNLTVIHVNADRLPETIQTLPINIDQTFKIGFWAWETMDFPEIWCDRFDLVDEVWVASKFMADAVRAKATVPVFVIPHIVNPPLIEPDRNWLNKLLPEVAQDEFLFLFQFDALSVPYRKNPEGAIKAFIEAFPPDLPVRLIVKTLNADRAVALIENLQTLASTHRVTIFDGALGDTERFRLLATIDCFVSLHRAEGFGLSIAEAMAYGKPVIATNWSGNTDFMNDSTAALVKFNLKATEMDHAAYSAGTIWAEPDINDAARLMRKIYEAPAWRKQIGEAAAARIAAKLGPDVIGQLIKSRLDRIFASKRFCSERQPDVTVFQNRSLSNQLARNIVARPGYFLVRLGKAVRFLYANGLRAAIERTWLHMK